jgi:hypothetical protein
MNSLDKKSSVLFERFVEDLATIDLTQATALPAAIGVMAVTSVAAMDRKDPIGPLQRSGLAGLSAFRAALATNQISAFAGWVQRSVEGKAQPFDGNQQARRFAMTAVAPLLNMASVSLARNFRRLKSLLNDKVETIRELGKSPAPEVLEPTPDGRFAWASEREQAPTDGGSWRDHSNPPVAVGSRIGATEMIRRLALAHRINVNELVIQGDEIRQTNVHSGDRPICKMGSVYWNRLEQETLTVHRFAQKHQLNADALYVRDGVVYEENREAFVDRTVCTVESPAWNEMCREMVAEVAARVAVDLGAPHRDLPDHEDVASALVTLGEDVTVERITEVGTQISALRHAQHGTEFTSLESEVDMARRAIERVRAAATLRATPAVQRDFGPSKDDASLAPSM